MPAAVSPFRIAHTVCSHDCPNSCAVLVTVNGEGRAVKVEGYPSQPVTRGFLCGKIAKCVAVWTDMTAARATFYSALVEVAKIDGSIKFKFFPARCVSGAVSCLP